VDKFCLPVFILDFTTVFPSFQVSTTFEIAGFAPYYCSLGFWSVCLAS